MSHPKKRTCAAEDMTYRIDLSDLARFTAQRRPKVRNSWMVKQSEGSHGLMVAVSGNWPLPDTRTAQNMFLLVGLFLNAWFAMQSEVTDFVSHSLAPAVVRYIGQQEKHHRRVTFQEELIALLKKNGIAYHERYIWS